MIAMIVVVMGVSGVGKTTLGRQIAARLGSPFIDADDHHPEANVAKMAAGVPLEDADRWPWLDKLNALLRGHAARGESALLACSALKTSYRERLLRNVDDARLVYLHAPIEVIRARLADRPHRYMPASLIDSQFATLQAPAAAIAIDVSRPEAECLEQALRELRA